MTEEELARFAADTGGCEEAPLDAALRKGIFRAKNDRLDSRKLLRLAAACVVTAALCLGVKLGALQSVSGEYHRFRNESIPGGGEALSGYIKDMTENFTGYLGGR